MYKHHSTFFITVYASSVALDILLLKKKKKKKHQNEAVYIIMLTHLKDFKCYLKKFSRGLNLENLLGED